MSLASDPLDVAFPDNPPQAHLSGDPLDAAFPEHDNSGSDKPKPKRVGWAEENLAGPGEVIGSALANIPHAAAHGAVDLYRRVTGGDLNAPDPAAVRAIQVPTGAGGQQLLSDIKGMIPSHLPGDEGSGDVKEAATFGMNPTEKSIIGHAGAVAGDVGALAAGAQAVRSIIPTRSASFVDPQSVGASHVPAPDFSNAEPDIQAAVAKMSPRQLSDNQATLQRHSEAQSLPVKIRLTAGQATGNPDTLSDELNTRGATGLSQHLNEQGQQLKDNLQVIRENVGPDVFSTNHVEHGDALIQAYKDKDAPIVADINQKYEALHQAAADAGIDTPIDGQAFANTAAKALRKKLLSNDVPSSVRADLQGFAEGEPMNFEDFESMRTKLAQEMRDNPSGNQRAAAGIVRQSLEDVPLQPEAAALKPLADSARAAARARFQALNADPAYDAAVNDKVSPDQFVNKFLTGTGGTASRAQAQAMRANLADNPQAIQTMGVATVDELRKAAGIGPLGEGKFGQSRFNTRLENMRPKLGALLLPESAEQMTTLGRVARYIKEQPEGNVINNSGTLSGAIAQGAGKVAKSYVNVKSGGVAGPVIDYVQTKLGEQALRKKFQDATAPLAGVETSKP